MPSQIFAKIGGIKGKSTDAKHKDEIEVLSFSWGVTNSGSGRRWRRRRQGDLPGSCHRSQNRQGVSVAPEGVRDWGAPEGRHHHASQGGKGQQEYLIIKMNDVFITGVVHGGSAADAPGSETVSLVFAKVDLEYKPQKADGSLDAGIHFKFDIKANKSG